MPPNGHLSSWTPSARLTPLFPASHYFAAKALLTSPNGLSSTPSPEAMMLCFSQRTCRHKTPCAQSGLAKRQALGPSIVLKPLLPYGPSHRQRSWSCLMHCGRHLGGLDVSVLYIQTKTMLNARTLSMCKYPYKHLTCTFVSRNCVLDRTCWIHSLDTVI